MNKKKNNGENNNSKPMIQKNKLILDQGKRKSHDLEKI